MEAIYMGGSTISAYKLDLPYYLPGSVALLAVIGLIVHANEPGIFTQDKNTSDKNK